MAEKTGSGTPRTDEMERVYNAWIDSGAADHDMCSLPDGWGVARTLETELTAALAALHAAQGNERDAERWRAFCNLWFASTVLEATQDEDGRWSIRQIEVADDIRFETLTGDTPEDAIDLALSREAGKEGERGGG